MNPSNISFAISLFLFPWCLLLPSNLIFAMIEDQISLLEFKKGIIADPFHALTDWNETNPLCNWHGVVCNPNSERAIRLDLKGKSLVGTISPYLSNLSSLELLELSDNYLQGPIPVEIGLLSNLELLGIEGNEIESEIPESFGKFMKLRYIGLSNNKLYGKLPTSLFYNCTKLSYLDLSNNSFTGSFPPQIGNKLLLLENILLYQNKLTGVLPSHILSHMPYLQILHLSYNNFSSDEQNSNLNPFFNTISNLTNLKELELSGNNLGGRIPLTIGQLSVNLTEIDLGENSIHGNIPTNVSNLSKLMLLDLSNNFLNETIPMELILLPNLQRLWLSNNLLSGPIPSPPRVLNSIGLLDLSRNKLFGAIPTSLSNLTQLRTLILDRNSLSGHIPPSLGSTKLELLDLSHNRLAGIVPVEVASLSSMAFYFNLSHNFLGGMLPMELGNMNKVRAIDLSSNNFYGSIPPTLAGCEDVEVLNLSNNSLQGAVPSSLGHLLNLQSLDLSSNFLSGEIPDSLKQCSSLKQLDVSFNNFSGAIPSGGVFDILTFESIEGNHFCGQIPGLPNCKHGARIRINSRRSFALLIISVSLSAFFLTVITVVGYRNIKTALINTFNTVSSKSVPYLSTNYPRITYRELFEATRGFREERLIGSGSFGRVYKGIMGDGTVVAVKVLQLQSSNSTRSFNRECQVLKRIRHRNLIRIITACSLANFKALVLPFMTNGSLENHLYPQEQNSGFSELSIMDCISICSDIAAGMAYLHHHSPVQVIHCDLKPSNILLNDDMNALVSDFGISRLVMTVTEGNPFGESTTNSAANLLCGSIGYVAPEYGYGRTASTKGDVYSFGVLALEMVTRKRPTDDIFTEGLILPKWVRNHFPTQQEKIISSTIMQELQNQSQEKRNMWEVAIKELIEQGILCTQETPSMRPTMIDVADDLERLKGYLGDVSSSTDAEEQHR
ncbi:putative leucine-rich repeat receptor-like serine/threonine-protein kinase At2g24130 isoform X2 [Phalaenopsis equestris]|uniref:putative leucine-rich repeat receptor-like serine/threonine-protein kinase At2g24130 isoform X2 n=1 Tax=Phalaenopsis equestris TaxID=78828 RepID=UPI0009E502C2|nr:putative leucine-rich repeat receptor-like serine/threonine-protein kinase At2g24130 isoform X2 [Phalaenopsis equestris]